MIADISLKNKDNDNDNDKEKLKSAEIFILGSINLHKELLSYAIEKGFGFKCKVIESIDSLSKKGLENPGEPGEPVKMRLILIDSVEHSFEKVLKDLSLNGRRPSSSFMLALFNLSIGTGVERKALDKQIKGFFYKHDSLELLLKGIRALFNKETWISRGILLKCVLEGFNEKRSVIKEKTALTQREIDILNMVSMGSKNEEIAAQMYISPHTVKTHLYNIFKKIKVSNRLQAALWAAKHL